MSLLLLCLIAKENRPEIVFLIETRIRTEKADGIKRKLEMEGCIVVEPRGMSGGLMVLWKKEDQVELLNYSQWHISLWVKGRRGRMICC